MRVSQSLMMEDVAYKYVFPKSMPITGPGSSFFAISALLGVPWKARRPNSIRQAMVLQVKDENALFRGSRRGIFDLRLYDYRARASRRKKTGYREFKSSAAERSETR